MNMLHIWYLRVPLRMENMLNTYFDVIQAIENFLELHEVQKVIKNQLFSCFWASKSPFSLASNQKKSHVCTFSCIKTVWSIVWRRHLLLRVPMDLNMCQTLFLNVIITSKNFGGSLKERVVICKITIFLDTSSWFSFLKWFSIHYLSISLSGEVFAIKNCAVHRLMLPLHSTRA